MTFNHLTAGLYFLQFPLGLLAAPGSATLLVHKFCPSDLKINWPQLTKYGHIIIIAFIAAFHLELLAVPGSATLLVRKFCPLQ